MGGGPAHHSTLQQLIGPGGGPQLQPMPMLHYTAAGQPGNGGQVFAVVSASQEQLQGLSAAGGGVPMGGYQLVYTAGPGATLQVRIHKGRSDVWVLFDASVVNWAAF